MVLSVSYRLAPEHDCLAAVDAAWAALNWAATHAGELGADPARLVVGGESAGATLSALVAQRARDGGPALVVLTPYKRHGLAKKVFTYGQMSAAAGERRIWR